MTARAADSPPGSHVVMFHIGRCGSTVLGNLLGAHPRIAWASELYAPIFMRWRQQAGGVERVGRVPVDPLVLLRANLLRANRPIYGLEVKPFHLRLLGCPQKRFIEQTAALGFGRYVLLDRENRLRKVVSSVIAHGQPTRHHLPAGQEAPLNPVRIDPACVRIDFAACSLLELLEGYEADMAHLAALLGDDPARVLRLSYEADIEQDPRVAYERVCAFLGVTPGPEPPNLAKTNPFPLRELIENDDEVAAALAGTPYAWMLDG